MTQQEWQNRLTEAIEIYHKAVKGNRKATTQAYNLLKELNKEQPSNVEIFAYFGSVTALMARDTPIPKDKKKFALEGLEMLDQAVKKSRDNITIRILRGNVCMRMPESVFHRTQTAVDDFEYLIDRYKKNPTILTQNSYENIVKDLTTVKKRLK
ncbi:hypothetical protein FS935_06940 [Metabacillus litoralis]|uniref:Tetratricopeptide repeat protein n=1 Tax=Metabacillus litoralis TaxID=152268 RepID=A0A5C6W430_9BACI|nr:hypothetical protein [Metabacillus litoralis]TXC92110.1 hypothetical protein FS935_06940 [Metabacillus litoralis]